MTWRPGELWLDTDVLWFREAGGAFGAAIAVDALRASLFAPAATGLEASRQRRQGAEAARRRKRLATRTVPAVALVVGSATMLPIAWLRHGEAARGAQPLQEDPPSLTFHLTGAELTEGVDAPLRRWAAASLKAPATPASIRAADFANVEWRRARSVGLWYSGRLVDGTQLPVGGPDWVTWDPVTDRTPNQPSRLYGNEHTIRTVISVIAAYRAAHPNAPRVVISDIGRRDGGPWTTTSRIRTAWTSISLPAARPSPARPDRGQPDRPLARPGSARPLRPRRRADDLRRLLDRDCTARAAS